MQKPASKLAAGNLSIYVEICGKTQKSTATQEEIIITLSAHASVKMTMTN